MPAISVILPVYNVEKYLRRCLNSVFNQTFKGEYEVICVNDGSTDSSPDILNEYALAHKNLTIINQRNFGVSEARNKALEVARGKYILFVDSDDLIALNTLEDLYNFAEDNSSDVVIFDHIQGNGDATKTSKFNLKENIPNYVRKTFNIQTADASVYRFIPVAAWAKFYKTDLIRDFRFEKNMYYEDVPFWDFVYTAAKRVIYLPVPFYYYALKPNEGMMSHTGKNVFNIFKSYSLSRKILTDAGYFEKFKSIFFAHFACNLIYHLNRVDAEYKAEFIEKIKETTFDIDVDKFDKEDFCDFEKINLRKVIELKSN